MYFLITQPSPKSWKNRCFMRQTGMRSLSLQHTDRPARVSGRKEESNGRCVFRSGGKCYDDAINVFVVRSRVSCHESNIERPICRASQLRLEGSIVGPVGEGTFHTLIAAPPEEERSHEIPSGRSRPRIRHAPHHIGHHRGPRNRASTATSWNGQSNSHP